MPHPARSALAIAIASITLFAPLAPPAAASDDVAEDAPPEACGPRERNPETASIFDPACNPFMLVRVRRAARTVDPLSRYVILPPEPSAAPTFARPASLASSSSLARTPERMAREARFGESPITLPASYRALEQRLRIDANAQLMRPEPDRVGVAIGAAAEFAASSAFVLRARTDARPNADGFALTFGAAAEIEPAPTLRLRAQTEIEERRPRYQVGARAQIVPRHLDLEMVCDRSPAGDADAWTWRTQLTFRAPFLD